MIRPISKTLILCGWLTVCAAGTALTGCSSDDEDVPEFITIDARVSGQPAQTRALRNGLSMAFEAGDRLSVYAWTTTNDEVSTEHMIANGAVNTLGQNGQWTSSPQMRWADMAQRHYFLGIYPVRTVTDFKADPYRLTGNVGTDDLLVGTDLSGITPTGKPVTLTFDHLLAMLKVNLIFRNQWGGIPASVGVSCPAVSSGTIDYLSRQVTPGTPETVSLTQSKDTLQGYHLSFEGIMIPQDGFRELNISVNGETFPYVHPKDIPLLRGNATTVNLIVGRNLIELGNIVIDGWESEIDLNGDAERQIK